MGLPWKPGICSGHQSPLPRPLLHLQGQPAMLPDSLGAGDPPSSPTRLSHTQLYHRVLMINGRSPWFWPGVPELHSGDECGVLGRTGQGCTLASDNSDSLSLHHWGCFSEVGFSEAQYQYFSNLSNKIFPLNFMFGLILSSIFFNLG